MDIIIPTDNGMWVCEIRPKYEDYIDNAIRGFHIAKRETPERFKEDGTRYPAAMDIGVYGRPSDGSIPLHLCDREFPRIVHWQFVSLEDND